MEESKNIEKVFDLVSSKSFDMLNEEERNLALSSITEEEYKAMYELHHNAGNVMKQDVSYPGNNIKDRLLSAYDERYGSGKRKKGSILLMKVPLYQVAASIILAVVMTAMSFYLGEHADKAQPQIVYQLKRDTIFVDPDGGKEAGSTASIAMDSASIGHTSQHGKTDNEANTISIKDHEPDDCRLCHSIKKDHDLKQFMVSSI